jgi:hypothetical protein
MRPQPDQYSTQAEYRWAQKQWKRTHGRGFFGTLVIAIFFGALTGSTTLLFGLVAFAIVATMIARSRP